MKPMNEWIRKERKEVCGRGKKKLYSLNTTPHTPTREGVLKVKGSPQKKDTHASTCTHLSTNVGSSAKMAFADHHPVVPNAKNKSTSVKERKEKCDGGGKKRYAVDVRRAQ